MKKKKLLRLSLIILTIALILPAFPVAAQNSREGYCSVDFEFDSGVEAVVAPDGKPIEEADWVTKFADSDKLYSKCDETERAYVCFDVKLKDGYEISRVYESNEGTSDIGWGFNEYCVDVRPYAGYIDGDRTFFIETVKSSEVEKPERKPLSESELKDIYTAIAAADKYSLFYLDLFEWSKPYADRSFRHGEKVNSFLAVAAFEYLGFAEYANLKEGGFDDAHIIPISYLSQKLDEAFVKHDISDITDLDIEELIFSEQPGGSPSGLKPAFDSQNVSFMCYYDAETEFVSFLNYDVYADEYGRAAKIAVQGCYTDEYEEIVTSVDELVLVYDSVSGNWKIDEYYPLDFTVENGVPVYKSQVTGVPYDPEKDPGEAEAIPGDTDGNGEIGNNDVLEIFKYLVGQIESLFNGDAADVNGDGEVTNADALMILRHIFDPSSFPLK